jgi:hypothetical protein
MSHVFLHENPYGNFTRFHMLNFTCAIYIIELEHFTCEIDLQQSES